MEFNYQLLLKEPKKISLLELFKTSKWNRFINYLIPSTANIQGNEDKTFRVIYKHDSSVSKEILQEIIQQLVSPDNLIKAKAIPEISKIIIDSEKVVIQTFKPVEDLEQIKKIFELLLSFSSAKTLTVELKPKNQEEILAIKLMKVIISSINNNSIVDSSMFSEHFTEKFQLILTEMKTEAAQQGVKMTLSMSPFPKITIQNNNQETWKVIVSDTFTIKTLPFVKTFENSTGETSNWQLFIDKKTKKLIGMDEDIWGNYTVTHK